MRNLIAKYYIVALPIITVITVVWLYYSPRTREDITLAITITGGVISFFFVVQKQQLEYLQTFKELFNDFNSRYDQLNEKLNHIATNKIDAALTESETDTLYDYFNLCAEEYLYYRRGYIYKEVWTAWCYGMRSFLENSRILPIWQQEEKTNSYYGLTLRVIKNGSRPSREQSLRAAS